MTEIRAFSIAPDGEVRQFSPGARAMGEFSPPEDGFLWFHVNTTDMSARDWLSRSGLPGATISALCATDTRPRCEIEGDSALISLRGVNMSPDEDPEDMVSVRLYLSAGLVVSTWRRPLAAMEDLITHLGMGSERLSPGALVARLALRLSLKAEPVMEALSEHVDGLEDRIGDEAELPLRGEVGEIRRRAIVFHRHLLPQRDALSVLEIEDLSWLGGSDRARLREAVERVMRLGEELDMIRDRAQVLHDQVTDLRAERMNRQMLLLSVVSAVFLPLTFVTGLLGMNVAGLPGTHWPGAFWSICVLMALIALVLILLFRLTGYLGGK